VKQLNEHESLSLNIATVARFSLQQKVKKTNLFIPMSFSVARSATLGCRRCPGILSLLRSSPNSNILILLTVVCRRQPTCRHNGYSLSWNQYLRDHTHHYCTRATWQTDGRSRRRNGDKIRDGWK